VQGGQVVVLDPLHPVGQAVAAVFVHEVGEVTDVAGDGLQLGAAREDFGELGVLVGGEVLRVGHDPAGYTPRFRDRRPGQSRRGRHVCP
jgi:hypothetical protein